MGMRYMSSAACARAPSAVLSLSRVLITFKKYVNHALISGLRRDYETRAVNNIEH